MAAAYPSLTGLSRQSGLLPLLLLSIILLTPAAKALQPVANTKEGWVEFDSFLYEGTDAVCEAAAPDRTQYCNPILAGFYPDPSVCRVGDDFYLVNSSFSYYPGVPIFHSRDLVNWTQLGHVLDRPSQLDLDGQPVSCGIFAPALSYHQGRFYMITTNVQGIGNFYVTATDPSGPWSDPVTLPLNGIDPSFFFDDDGQAYIVHNGPPPDNKSLYDGHRAIWLWRFNEATHSVSEGRIIINGGVNIADKPSWIEGPHLFRRDGWYYLCAAEGGTSVNHSQVIFRSRSLDEPFVPLAENPILTQRDLPAGRPSPVTSVGHAQLVDTPAGEWWAVFLGVRPYQDDYYNTGRETFLLPVTWSDGWPRILPKGTELPRVGLRPRLPAPKLPARPTTGSFVWKDDFKSPTLDLSWVFLRTPREPWWSLTAKPGALLIAPRAVALDSVHGVDKARNGNPSFIAHRQCHADFRASTRLSVSSVPTRCDAGLAALQNDSAYLFIAVRTDASGGHSVILERHTSENGPGTVLAGKPLSPSCRDIELRLSCAGDRFSLDYREEGAGEWTSLASSLDARLLSTHSAGGFVGTMLGLYARRQAQEP